MRRNKSSEFTSLGDFYNSIEALRSALQESGDDADAESIDHALKKGATSSEILGDLSLALEAMTDRHSGDLLARIKAHDDFARQVLGLDR
jgi:hypothetical protein